MDSQIDVYHNGSLFYLGEKQALQGQVQKLQAENKGLQAEKKELLEQGMALSQNLHGLSKALEEVRLQEATKSTEIEELSAKLKEAIDCIKKKERACQVLAETLRGFVGRRGA